MCYHKSYNFLACGHTVLGSLVRACASFKSYLTEAFEQQSPINERELARLARHMPMPNPCPDRQRHAFQTLNLHRMCYACERAHAIVDWELEQSVRSASVSMQDDGTKTWSNQPWVGEGGVIVLPGKAPADADAAVNDEHTDKKE